MYYFSCILAVIRWCPRTVWHSGRERLGVLTIVTRPWPSTLTRRVKSTPSDTTVSASCAVAKLKGAKFTTDSIRDLLPLWSARSFGCGVARNPHETHMTTSGGHRDRSTKSRTRQMAREAWTATPPEAAESRIYPRGFVTNKLPVHLIRNWSLASNRGKVFAIARKHGEFVIGRQPSSYTKKSIQFVILVLSSSGSRGS